MKEGQVLATGFQLLIGLAEIHVPRMWAERLPENSDSQVCIIDCLTVLRRGPVSKDHLLLIQCYYRRKFKLN